MQYILTVEEFKSLQEAAEKGRKSPEYKDLLKLCQQAADSIVLQEGWMKGNVWGCILSVERNEYGYKEEWYCDDCPAQKVCPYPYKHWSK